MDYAYLWDGLAPLATEWRLVFYEQSPRHGEPAAGASAARQVDELGAVVRHVADERGGRVRIVAHSWGSYLTLELLRRNTAPVSHAVLVAPAPLSWQRLQASQPRFVSRVDPADLAEVERLEKARGEGWMLDVLRLTAYAYLAPAHRGLVRPRFGRADPAANAAVMASVAGFDQTGIGAELGEVSLTLVLGEHDFSPAEDTAEIGLYAHTVVLADCGHFPFDEQPDLARQTVREALHAPPTRRPPHG
jgi:pimeloyl-ACP methyl ester carboxylesterase